MINPVVFLALTLLSFFTEYRMIDARLFDWLSTSSPPEPENSPVILVRIDEPSFRELGLQWPWPREIHGKLIDALTWAGASVIAMDIVFAEASDPESDRALAEAVGRAPAVVLAAEEAIEEGPYVSQSIRIDPLEDLISAGAKPGVAAVTLSPDGILRRMPLRADGFAMTALDQWISANGGSPVASPAPLSETPRYLQYFGPSRSYPGVSYYQALSPEEFLPPGIFENRIVIVGLGVKASPETDRRQGDVFATPFTRSSGALMAGMEVQATILDNLRLGVFIRPAPMVLIIIGLGAFLAVLGMLFYPWRPWRSAVTAIVLIAAVTAGSFLLLRFGRIWMSPSLFLLAIGTGYIASGGLAFFEEQAGRRYIKQAFSQYLAPALVDQLAVDRSRLHLGGESRRMTVLFCDVRGFTSLSERFAGDPQGLVHVMNRLFSALTAVILKYGGTVDKYIGDCVMAFWNAPLEDPDHAVHACAAALEMVSAVQGLNAEFAAENENGGQKAPALDVGIGINTGWCVVGNIGSTQRFDYSVLGDPVNLASRLEGQSKNYGVRIVIGPETQAAIPDFAALELDLIAVKGKTEALHVFGLLGGPELKKSDSFEALKIRHGRLLESFRKKDWAAAKAAMADCRRLGPDLARLYDLYARRINFYEANPPDAAWKGVYVADKK